MNLDKIDVSIVMPCLNEAKTLTLCIMNATEALKKLKDHGLNGEIIISDNGSTDGSQQIALENGCRLVNCKTRGYGSALMNGIKSAHGKYIVMGDSDASYDFLDSVPMVLKLIEGYEICIGNRFKGKIMPGAMNWKNQFIGNPVLSGLLNLFFQSIYYDAHCGLRAFTKNAFEKMELSCQGMEFASEMVIKATILKLNGIEIPITLYKDKRGKASHLRPWIDGWRHLKLLLIYSPLWFYFVPSMILIILSTIIFIGLLLTPPHETFGIKKLRFGDHWMIIAAGLFQSSYQIFFFGLASLINRVKQDSIPRPKLLKKVITSLTPENAILLGISLIFIGLSIIGYSTFIWITNINEPLYKIREIIIGVTFVCLGLQTFFGGFLISAEIELNGQSENKS